MEDLYLRHKYLYKTFRGNHFFCELPLFYNIVLKIKQFNLRKEWKFIKQCDIIAMLSKIKAVKDYIITRRSELND